MKILCPYCYEPARLIDSAQVYHGYSFGMIWACAPCDAYVGTHKDSGDHAPLGTLANKELRSWRHRAHAVFDPLWERKMRRDKVGRSAAREKGYAWLVEELGIERGQCHIGMMDVEQCKKVVELCQVYCRPPRKQDYGLQV